MLRFCPHVQHHYHLAFKLLTLQIKEMVLAAENFQLM